MKAIRTVLALIPLQRTDAEAGNIAAGGQDESAVEPAVPEVAALETSGAGGSDGTELGETSTGAGEHGDKELPPTTDVPPATEVSTSPPATINTTNLETVKVSSGPSAEAGPSLPPFLKTAAVSSVAAPAVAPTQRGTVETSTAEAVDDGKIDGVGFVGTPPPASSGCKCSIM